MFIKVISAQKLESDHVQSHVQILRAMGCEEKTLADGSIAFGSEKNQAIERYPHEWFRGDFSKM